MSISKPSLRLDHLYLTARKPDWLAEWYAETFGFRADAGLVISGGIVLVFQQGEPLINPIGKPQFGFRCEKRDQLLDFAKKLGAQVRTEPEFCSFQAKDPEGYLFEIYWEGA